MTPFRVVLFLVALVAIPLGAAEIGMGASRDEVLRLTGKPTSRAQRGDHEIFLFAGGGRIEFVAGKVVDVRGPLPSAPAAPPPEPSPQPEPQPAKKPPATAPATPATPAGTTPATALQIPEPNDEPGPVAAMEAFGREVGKMNPASDDATNAMPARRGFEWPGFAVSLLLHFGITLLALRIAFKIEEMDALWSGVFAIAGIDLAVYATLEALGPFTGGISSSAGIEGGIGALVMVFTIRKFCFSKRLQYAVATAFAVKLVVQLCHIFVFAILLNALFG